MKSVPSAHRAGASEKPVLLLRQLPLQATSVVVSELIWGSVLGACDLPLERLGQTLPALTLRSPF